MASLYAKHCKEALNLEVIEDEISFVSLQFLKAKNIHCVKIIDMYIEKEHRGKKKSIELLESVVKLGKERGCNLLSAQISKFTHEDIQNRTKYLCGLAGMKKTYEDYSLYIFTRSI